MSGGPFGRGKAPERACLALQYWPDEDRQLWLAAIAPAEPLDEHIDQQAKSLEAHRQYIGALFGKEKAR